MVVDETCQNEIVTFEKQLILRRALLRNSVHLSLHIRAVRARVHVFHAAPFQPTHPDEAFFIAGVSCF